MPRAVLLSSCLPRSTHARIKLSKPAVQGGNGAREDSVQKLDEKIDGRRNDGNSSSARGRCLVQFVDVETD
jgi:hypothetical protein